MKKFFALLFTISVMFQSFAVGVVLPPKNANDVYLPIGITGQRISLMTLSQLDIKTFETLSGRHLGFMDRIGFKIAQRDLRKSIKEDGTINSKKLNRFLKRSEDHSTGFHIGGFALGFFVGVIGVLIAYLINDDNKRNRAKWAWIGFGVYVALVIALVATMA
jgi:hypothetical protein